VQIGKFDVEFVSITHSTLEPNVLYIKTPLGNIVHTGDWKIDPQPLVGPSTDIERLIEIGKSEGRRILVCDSTNALSEGSSGSEQSVRDELMKLIAQYKDKRVSVACFASNIARLETIILTAQEVGRKVCLIGTSLHRMTDAAKDAGYLQDIDKSIFIDDRKAADMPYDKVLFITTGSQGEHRSGLSRIAYSQHHIKMGKDDVVFFSSRVIPGNEKSIGDLQNRLIEDGVTIITSCDEDIHVSGHPSREELRQMYDWIKPHAAVPVHGEVRHLQAHAELARSMGCQEVLPPVNGSLIQLNKTPISLVGKVHAGRWALDGKRMIPEKSSVLKKREIISRNGVIFLTATVNESGKIISQFTALGVCEEGREENRLVEELKSAFRKLSPYDVKKVEKSLAEDIERLVKQTTNRLFGKKPRVEVHVLRS